MQPIQHDDVCVVVPMYNEASVIEQVVVRLRQTFPLVVCIDDGSRDGSAEIAAAAGARVLRHTVNFGQGAALQTGFDFAKSLPDVRFVITFDADGQHRVEDALALLDVARNEGHDVVFGSRFLGREASGLPGARRALLRASVAFTRLNTGLRLTDSHVGLRVLNRTALHAIELTLAGMAHASQLHDQVARRNLSYTERAITVDYTDYSRGKGQRNINAVNITLELMALRLRSGR